MSEFQLSPVAQQWTNVVLIWLGFGILTGLLAKSLIPGREPRGAVGVLLVGVLGSVVGPLALSLLFGGQGFNPITPLGLLSAVGGAIILLVGYRLTATYLFHRESDDHAE